MGRHPPDGKCDAGAAGAARTGGHDHPHHHVAGCLKNYQDGGQQAKTARDVALEAVIEGLDALAFYVQTVTRFDRDLMLTSGFVL